MSRMGHGSDAPDRPSGWWKLTILAVVVATVGIGLQQSGLADRIRLSDLYGLRDSLGLLAPFVFLAAYTVCTIVGVPGLILTLTGGLVFGSLAGGLLVEVGASLGATGAFFLARAAGRDVVARIIKGNVIERFDHRLSGAGLPAVVFSRVVPVFPFTYMNFMWGVTGIRTRDYIVGTVVGMIPACFVYANIAASVARSLEGTDPTLASIEFRRLVNPDVLLAFALLGVLAIVPPILKYVVTRRAEARMRGSGQ